ncbi:MAG: nitroreductase family protein [candidate division WOR-3 bacterium]
MNVFEAIKWRRSVREFSSQKIEPDKLLQILEAGRLAPSSSNRQAWHFVVVDNENLIKKIPEKVIIGTKGIISWIKDAPLVIVGCYTKAITHFVAGLYGRENHLIDISIAMTQMVLEATELGIGSCFIGWFNEKHVKRLLQIPDGWRIAMLVVFGYPKEKSTPEGIGGIKPRPRKELKEIVSYNGWGRTLPFGQGY